MDFKVNCGIWGAMFGVPSIVVDNFLKLATGGQIKVLLYLLRCSGKECSAEEISANTGVSANEAEEAVMFWQQANILSPQANPEIQPISSVITAPQPIEAKPAVKNAVEPVLDHKTSYSGSDIAAIMKDSQDIRDMFKIAEGILGTLTISQMNSIIWMHDHLGLKNEVIITLITYCTSIEKTNTKYIDKIAANWAENDINSLNAAQEEIERLSASRDYIISIMKCFEMTHRPTTKQAELIQKWKTAGYGIELIHYAYEKTLEQINKLSFDYINKILISWNESGFKTVKDVKASESSFRKKKNSSSAKEADPDIEEYKSVINQFLY